MSETVNHESMQFEGKEVVLRRDIPADALYAFEDKIEVGTDTYAMLVQRNKEERRRDRPYFMTGTGWATQG